jgi:hypothetical protein
VSRRGRLTATMTKVLLVVVALIAAAVVAVLLLRGGGGKPPAETQATPTVAVQAYFYLGAALVPVLVQVPKTRAVAVAAAQALVAAPPSGYQTALPADLKVLGVKIRTGLATVTLSRPLTGRTRRGEGQIVYTLTQFQTVKRVELVLAQRRLALTGPTGSRLDRATRADFVDLTQAAPIFVSKPIDGSTVFNPVHVLGTASTFEATLALEVRKAGKLVHTESITATAGAPGRGTWETTLDLPPGSYELVFYEPSAEDGSHLHTTTVGIRVH